MVDEKVDAKIVEEVEDCLICSHGKKTYECSECESKECISCSIGKKRPQHQILEGNRNKI